jgi:hypothetical protein
MFKFYNGCNISELLRDFKTKYNKGSNREYPKQQYKALIMALNHALKIDTFNIYPEFKDALTEALQSITNNGQKKSNLPVATPVYTEQLNILLHKNEDYNPNLIKTAKSLETDLNIVTSAIMSGLSNIIQKLKEQIADIEKIIETFTVKNTTNNIKTKYTKLLEKHTKLLLQLESIMS